MPKTHKKIFKVTGIIILGLLIVCGLFAAWVIVGPASSVKTKLLSRLPLPLASVNGQIIPSTDLFVRYSIAQKAYAQQPTTDMQQVKTQIYNQLVREKETQILASRYGVSVSAGELNQQLQATKNDIAQDPSTSFNDFLKEYGLTEQQFKTMVLAPNLLSTDLTVWFNSQSSLNPQTYQDLSSIQQQLAQGTAFSALVPKYNQDPSTEATNGDMGFVPMDSIASEYQQNLEQTAVGGITEIINAQGIHVVKILAKDNNAANHGEEVHVQEILLQPADFNQWFNKQTKTFSIKKFIKIY